MDHFNAVLYGCYFAFFVLISSFEILNSRRSPVLSRGNRWPTNFGLFFINSLLLQLVSTAFISNLAYFTWKNGWGLLNHLDMNPVVQFLLSILLLDLMAYVSHVIYHKVPLGWKFHRVHHLDMDMDSTTGLLFHPFESLVSFIVRQPFVLLVGPSPLGVFFFDSIVLFVSLATHANIRFYPGLDRILKWLVVTPDMHRIHHSTEWVESNSNYGFLLSIWDRLFRTYVKRAKVPQDNMELGLKEFRDPRFFRIPQTLKFPFWKKDP